MAPDSSDNPNATGYEYRMEPVAGSQSPLVADAADGFGLARSLQQDQREPQKEERR